MSVKYKGQGNVRECIMKIFYVASKLKALKIKLSKELLILMVLGLKAIMATITPPHHHRIWWSVTCKNEGLPVPLGPP
ncbi:hypothetical protein J1N35_023453 [Gossypium stocksii]|uniref:Uncharacterized protein n=1 Tax=Gossypium stocksii TaxID=47602 RepID=A0A9D4A3P5_9ROSI|nr:hypothetical protein J1N35_023453 [Gossypium stocksii]